MADKGVLKLKVEEYIIVVSTPLKSPINIIANQTSAEAQEMFISKRDEETNPDRRIELERARALLKFAERTGAELLEMNYTNNKLMLRLKFDTAFGMNWFCEWMILKVSEEMNIK